jgi:hypothetical protein
LLLPLYLVGLQVGGSVLHALQKRNIERRYLMKRCGLKMPQQKLLFVHMRLSMLKTAREHWLKLYPSISNADSASTSTESEPVEKSDVFILTIACNQTARAAGKLMANGCTEPLSIAGTKFNLRRKPHHVWSC